nr:hypothetical protein [Allobaculum sp. Allo2]
MINDIKTILDNYHIPYRIFGRSKHFYSIHKKMVTKHKRFEEILDLQAIRIITDSIAHCYEILGYIHATYTPIPGRFKDYIAMPKATCISPCTQRSSPRHPAARLKSRSVPKRWIPLPKRCRRPLAVQGKQVWHGRGDADEGNGRQAFLVPRFLHHHRRRQ